MNMLFKMRAESSICEHIDFAVQQFFQVLTQFNEVEQAPTAFHIHEEIDVAVGPRVTPHY